MKNDIDNFIQNVLYNSLIKLGYIEEDLINVLSFNDKINQNNIAVEDLPEFNLKNKNNVSERCLSDVFNIIAKIILKDLETQYQLLFVFSGKIDDEDSSQLKAYDLANSLKNTANVESNVIQYIISNNEIDNSNDDKATNDINKETNYVLRNLSSIDIDIESPICKMNHEDSNEDKINKIVSMFSKNEKNEKRNSINSNNSSISIPDFVNSSNSSINNNFKTILVNSDNNNNILDDLNKNETKNNFIAEIRNKLFNVYSKCQIF